MRLKITQKKEKMHPYGMIHNILSTEAIHNVKHELKSEETCNKRNKKPTADRNSNSNILCKEMLRAKNKYTPSKLVKFNK